jgi:hypothetical protein
MASRSWKSVGAVISLKKSELPKIVEADPENKPVVLKGILELRQTGWV